MLSSQFVSRVSLLLERVASFDAYPFCLPALRDFKQLDLHPRMTILVGENGSGKSTLLEAIAVALGLNAEGGSKNFSFGTRNSHSVLANYLRLSKGIRKPRTSYFLRAESFFNVATEIEKLDAEPASSPPVIDSYGGISLHEQSHGESFMALLCHRFGADGLYLFDEPEAALSPQRQLAALARIHDLICEGSQFIMATHSPILMAYPDAQIYQLSQSGIEKIAYQDTEHYQVTRDFLLHPERMLKILMDRNQDDN